MMNEVAVGKYTGHDAALNVCLGFVPAALIILNLADPTIVFWTKDFGASDAIVDNDANVLEAANGIDVYTGGDEPDGTDAYQDNTGTALTAFATSGQLTEAGFTVATGNADLNTDGEAFKWIALGRSPQ